MTWSRQQRHKAGRYPVVQRPMGGPYVHGRAGSAVPAAALLTEGTREVSRQYPVPVTPEEDEAMDELAAARARRAARDPQ